MPDYLYQGIRIHYEMHNENLPVIVFFHGLGASSQVFRNAPEFKPLMNYRLLLIDLVGFGLSDKAEKFDYSMDSQAQACLSLLNYLDIHRISIIAHSMGGPISQFVSENIQVDHYINCEGNLTIDDCKLSASIYMQGFPNYKDTGFDELKAKHYGTPYYDSLCQTNAHVMFNSSKMLIQSCRNDHLLQRFIDFPARKLYVYGENNLGKRKSQVYLKDTGIPLQYIKDSGHNMIEDNPEHFYQTVIEFLNTAI